MVSRIGTCTIEFGAESLKLQKHLFKDLKRVRRVYACSSWLLQKVFYEQLGKNDVGRNDKLNYIPGRERVEDVTIDMCDPFKKFVREFFPNAKLTADKFHVLRLTNPMINRARTEITGDQRSNPVRVLLLRNRHRLKYFERSALDQWLDHHKKLKEIYWFKESLYQLYRTKGYDRLRLLNI